MKVSRFPGLLGVAGLGLAMLTGAAVLSPSNSALAQDQSMVADNLLTAIYVEQNCSGQKFGGDEWKRLVELVRELSPDGTMGESELTAMVRTKAKAREISAFDGCRHQQAMDYRDIFQRDLAPSL